MFEDAGAERRFTEAYERVLARWPVPVESLSVTTEHGVTHVNACGPAAAPPLVLLPGGGATSTVWFANVAELSARFRVLAIDVMGEPGLSRPGRRPIRKPADLVEWLDGVLAGLGIDSSNPAVLAGHSYGAWISLTYALARPERLASLTLLDPTQCFAGLRPDYLVRAIPVVLRPSGDRIRALVRWETGGAPLDPDWLDLLASGASDFPTNRPVVGRIDRARLAAFAVPTLVVLAERSRAHRVDRVRRHAQERMPSATVTVLPGATHHTMPMRPAEALSAELLEFASGGRNPGRR